MPVICLDFMAGLRLRSHVPGVVFGEPGTFPCRSAIRPWVRVCTFSHSFAEDHGLDTQFYISSLESAVYAGSKFSILTLENCSQSRTVFPGFAEVEEAWNSEIRDMSALI